MEKRKSILAGSLLTGAIIAVSSFSANAQKISFHGRVTLV